MLELMVINPKRRRRGRKKGVKRGRRRSAPRAWKSRLKELLKRGYGLKKAWAVIKRNKRRRSKSRRK